MCCGYARRVSRAQPFIERDYYSNPWRRARSGLARLLSGPANRVGFDLEVRSFYSPIPDLSRIPDTFWDRRSEMPGVDLGVERGFDLVENELASPLREFNPPRDPTSDRFEFFLSNGLFQGGDADLLYAVLRHYKPARVLELGAGFSTLVSATAVRRNRDEGHQTTFSSCDPYADPGLSIDGLDEIIPVAAEELDASLYGELRAGDVLFIDSSHTVRPGGDVVHLLCEVLPRLAPGVLVHVHDVFLPYPYPREWFEHNRWYWSEQYLLQAVLIGNAGLEVLLPAHAMWRTNPDRMGRAVHNLNADHPPISFWMRVKALSA